ncbi:MAG: hypothetical protein EOP52_02840 [Sphingobacteriales bacterium]|nr:MAG: hypothetical protein EOP52_02840 [Sphingobacteriales bacterium]
MKRIFPLLLLLLSFAAGAQDKIFVRTQKQPIVGIITEVGNTEVKYHLMDRPVPILTVEKQDIIRIQFESGQVMQLSDPSKDFNLYYDQHLWNAKVNLFSPINGHTQLFLEQAIKPSKSREFELNIIGLGIDPNMLDAPINPQTAETYTYEARGVGLGYGLRFIRMPDFVGSNTRLRHLMQGSYIKPAISLSYYQRNFVTYDYFNSSNTYTLARKPVFAALGSVSFGRQWILDNTISIDAYVLAGIGYDNVRSTQEKITRDAQGNLLYSYSDNTPYTGFGYTRFSKSDLGVALGAGLRIGFLFDWKQKTKTTIEK